MDKMKRTNSISLTQIARLIKTGVLLAIVVLIGSQSLQAAARAWNVVGDGEWGVAGNWTPATVPVAADVITFNAAGVNGNQLVYLAGARAATSLVFDNTGTTGLLGGTSGVPAADVLTLSGGITVNGTAGAVTIGSAGVPKVNISLSGSQTFTNNSAALLTIHSGMASSGTTNNLSRTLTVSGTGDTLLAGVLANNSAATLSLTKIGVGKLTLSGPNTYTGATAVSEGTLELTGSLTGTAVTVAQPATLTQSAAGSINGAVAVSILGTATLDGTNTYTGATTVNGGTLNLNGTLAATAITVSNGGSLVQAAAGVTGGAVTVTDSLATFAGSVNGTGAMIFSNSTVTLSGANGTSGAATLSEGTTTLDYSTQDNSKIAGVLSLNNTSLSLAGGTHDEQVTSTTINAGSSSISRSSGTAKLSLNAITRNIGATINFGADGVATTDTNNAGTGGVGGILGGYATVGATAGAADWAKSIDTGAADTDITAFTTYDAFVTSGGSATTGNYLLTGTSALTATQSAFSLKIDTSGTGESLDIVAGQTQTLTSGGLLFIGADNYEINNGTLKSNTATNSELIVHQWGAGELAINSVIANGIGNSTVTKTGTGTLVLGGANTYTGATYVTQGTLKAGAANVFGTGAGTALILSRTGTVDFADFNQTVGSLSNSTSGAGSIDLGSGTLTVGNTGTTATFAGVISGSGGITKVGTGTQTLTGANTYDGTTSIDLGILAVGNLSNAGVAGAMGSGTTASDLVFNGGTLRYVGGTNTSTDRSFTISSPTATLDAGIAGISMRFTGSSDIVFSSVGAHTLALTGNNSGTAGRNTGSYDLIYEVALNLKDSGAGIGEKTSVSKSGTGIWALGGNNTYSGGTTVNAGRLVAKSATALGTGDVNVVSGSTLLLSAASGVYNNNVTIAGTGGTNDSSSSVGATAALVLNNNANLAGILTLGDATATITAASLNLGSTNTGTISGKITGGFNLTFNSTSGSGQSVVTLSGTTNDYTGDTVIVSAGANSGSTQEVKLGASNVITNGVGKGNLVLNTGGGGSGSGYFSLNGFNETINGLVSAGVAPTGTGRVVRNNSTTNSTLTLGDADTTASYAGSIVNGSTGTLAITKIGAGTQTLAGTNSYTGATTVSGGTLLISGTLTGTSGVTVNTGGNFRYDGSTALNRAVTLDGGKFSYNSVSNYTGTLTFNTGTIAGSNISNLNLSIGTGKIMSPGNSTGTMASGGTIWATGGTFLFELNDTTGTAGSTSLGWDLLNAGALNITAGVGEFTIQIASLDGLQVAGNALNFDGTSNYTWLFVDAGSTITGFNASSFILNDSAFTNSTPGTFSITQGAGVDDDKLYLNYTGVIPEPSTYALLIGGLGLLAFLRRRKLA